jgi:hypothetical protein
MNFSSQTSTSYRKAAFLGTVALLCVGTSGYSSGCGSGDASPPPLEVDPSHVEWAIGNGDTTPRSLSVGVTQATGLAVSVRYQAQPPTSWLTAEITMTGNSLTLLLTASPQGLEPGIYDGLVVVTADEYAQATINVVLTITP